MEEAEADLTFLVLIIKLDTIKTKKIRGGGGGGPDIPGAIHYVSCLVDQVYEEAVVDQTLLELNISKC